MVLLTLSADLNEISTTLTNTNTNICYPEVRLVRETCNR
jgi:hypothetical protein